MSKSQSRPLQGNGNFRRSIVLSLSLLVGVSGGVQACEDWVARVVAVEGLVQRQTVAQDWQPLQAEQLVCPGETVQVGEHGRAALYLSNNTFARLDANTVLQFPAQQDETRFWIQLTRGIGHFISRIAQQFEVSTPYVNAVVDGTEFLVAAEMQGSVSVIEGEVTAYNRRSRVAVPAGEQIVTASADQDLTRLKVNSASLVEWAIFYPPVLLLSELQPQVGVDRQILDAAIQALRANRIDKALVLLAVDQPSDVIRVAQATLLLQLGDVAAFERVLQPALSGDLSAEAHSLVAIAAIARGDTAGGLRAAQVAVERAPQLAAGWLAQSYALQARLDLPEALSSARRAVEVQPDSVLAYLRLSELHLALGDAAAARKVLAEVPGSAIRTAEWEGAQGFAQLLAMNAQQAQSHFRNAIALDSAHPQYHLGLGLALLRDGDLERGRRELEYAVSLDPRRSVTRSYMGRAYFAGKRDAEALEQWGLAKQFDPNDPTPYFYTGVQKLLVNDPVGAVQELERARDLNANRAPYRGEQLLQSDAATRSATLARAYQEAGYSQGVLLSGWEATRLDPASSEGHRLLADHYAGDPRYETARVSELFQSQIWAPLTAYPLQPQLAETDLALVAGAGPQTPGLNEYHSLFTRDGLYGSVNGYGAGDGAWGNDLTGSILAGPLALSLGQYHFESDGWRDNADQTQDIYSGMLQWQVTTATQLQLEYRTLDWDRGDLAPRWDGKQSRMLFDNQERETARVSLTHRFDPANALAVSYVTQQFDNDQAETQPDFLGRYRLDQQPETWEVQGVHKASAWRWVYGAGRTDVDIDSRLAINLSLFDDSGLPTYIAVDINTVEDTQQQQEDVYAYSYWSPVDDVLVELGITYTDLALQGDSAINTVTTTEIPLLMFVDVSEESSEADVDAGRSRWSPKFGLTAGLTDSLSLRVAAFRSVSKLVAAGQTLEPVTVAGFNQYFADRDGLRSRNGALGLDYTASSSIRLGASFMRRLLDGESVLDATSTADTRASENLADAYAHVQLSPQWVLLAGYQYSVINDSYYRDAVDGISYARTDRVPLEVRWFPGGRVSAALKYTHFRHRFEFNDGLPTATMDEQKANVVDVSVGYRLPERMGLLEAGIRNVTDEDTEILYHREDGESLLGFYPAQQVFCRINLNF